jgi:hypothetical protein
MICKKYDNLSHVDKIRYIGELIHIVQNDDEFYEMGVTLINKAREKGILDGVLILPEVKNDNDNQ